ncbi:synemin [Trichomycterus rosablanca]|uniref:synemin n=1 Tax=Trichomycterus rosablanca TaxID=2290929 RepID=UPI002F35CEA9
MFHPKKTFEGEKLQLQELNQRLAHYLSRSKQLEQENARLITEITTARHNRSEEWESKRMAELRETRRLVEKLSFDKHAAEMERDQLRKELHFLQAMRSDESSLSKDLSGELKGCEKQLRQALHTNASLEDRLLQLQNEYALLEDAHRNEVAELRNQARSRVLPVIVRTHPSPPAFSAEEVQQYALSLSERWTDTFEMYREQVEKIEESIKADQVRLEDIRREKMEYASELNRLRAEMEKHSRIQLGLEEQLMDMQEKFREEFSHYQVIVEELEHERMLLANTVSEKLKDYQDLLQVKRGLGLELAAYRALLEGEGKHAEMKFKQQSRERIIDIKMPAHPYTPRVPTMTATQPTVRRQFLGYDVRNVKPISSMMTSAVSSHGFKSHEPSRILPITKSSHAQQSPAERRDMISFSKARQAATLPSTAKSQVPTKESTKEVLEKVTVIKGLPQDTPLSSASRPQRETEHTCDLTASSTTEMKSVRVVSPPMMSLNAYEEIGSQKVVEKNEGMEERPEIRQAQTVKKPDDKQYKENKDQDQAEAKLKPDEAQFISEEDIKKVEKNGGQKVFASEEKILDAAFMEEIIEKVIKPAGLDPKLSSSADTKITYHVEKTKKDDGSTTTQIVLESKIEEDVDLSDFSALDELLNKRVQQISLEDIEGTPTVSVIQNLISLGLQGESLENKSVKLQIIETPIDYHSEEDVKLESEEFEEVKSKPYFQPSLMLFHIEEPENELQVTEHGESLDETPCYVKCGTVQVQEVSREEGLPYYPQGVETQEYLVSSPEDNMSESEEGGAFMSYGHYGVVDDLSDERYYQDESLLTNRRYSDERDSYRESPDSVKGERFPECIIEEEVHVSPTMQECMLEILKEESLGPREQLTGALEQLEGTVSGALKEELALLTKASEDSDNLSFNIKKVEQAQDNGTLTYVAEVSVSQSLEDSGLFQDETDYPTQEQMMAALKSSSLGDYQAISAGAGGGYTIRASKEEVQTEEMPGITSLEETEDLSSASEVTRTEKVIRLGPNERSFTFQMDVNNSLSGSDKEGMDFQGQRGNEASVQEFVQTQVVDPSLKIYTEKRIATVYLEKPEKD